MIGKSSVFALALGLCWVVAGQAGAAEKQAAWTAKADTPEAFKAQAAEVRKQMGTDGKYGAIDVADRTAVDADLDKIEALLARKGSATKLSDNEQVDLMNAQERINALLTKNDGNRLICTMEARSGTHFKQKVCQTARERDDIRRRSQQGFQEQLQKNPSMSKGN